MSEAEKAIVRRASVLIVALERLEVKFALDEGAETERALDQYQRMSNTMRRLFESVGLKRRQKQVPSLDQYLKQRGRKINGEAIA